MPNITKPSGLSNIWANGGTKLNPGAAKVNIGWVVQLPPYEYQNWVDNRQDQAIAHISQHGIPEWDALTEYQGLLSYTQGSDGRIYKCVQTNTGKDPVNVLNDQFWALAFESFGSVKVVSDALAAHILNYQTLAGVGNVAAARSNLSVYSKAESDARFASLNGNQSQVFSVGLATQPQHAVRLSQVSGLIVAATESVVGVVRLATTGITEQGTDDTTVLTPLKAANVYLKKSGNLAGLANVATARTNLGLGTAATQASATFLQTSRNLADVPDKAAARANLGITPVATLPDGYYLKTTNNLADVPDKGAARNNLGLADTATMPSDGFMRKSNNLYDVADPAAARNALGLADTAIMSSDNFLKPGYNLGDVPNKQAARNNLGLGNAATMNVFGASGLDFTSANGGNGYTRLPNGLLFQWGSIGHGNVVTITDFGVTFPVTFSQVFQCVASEGGQQACSVNTMNLNNGGFTARVWESNGITIDGIVRWFAIGI